MTNSRIVWINGGTGAIGFALAKWFAQKGDKVIASYSTEITEEILSESKDILFIKADCKCLSDVQRCAKRIKNEYGTLDILINNAGIGSASTLLDAQVLSNIVQNNLVGKYNCIFSAVELLRHSSNPCIVNIASASGVNPSPIMTAYCVAAAGIIMMTKCLAKQLGDDGIRVNCVSPTALNTGMSVKSFTKEDLDYLASVTPSGRLCTTNDICNCVDWLCSESAFYINGENIMVTGGK